MNHLTARVYDGNLEESERGRTSTPKTTIILNSAKCAPYCDSRGLTSCLYTKFDEMLIQKSSHSYLEAAAGHRFRRHVTLRPKFRLLASLTSPPVPSDTSKSIIIMNDEIDDSDIANNVTNDGSRPSSKHVSSLDF